METANKLSWVKTYTVEQFKNKMQVEQLEVKRNPKTGKLFFLFGVEIGAVASKGIPEKPMVSLVEGDRGQFYLLHEMGEGAPTIATF